MMKKRLLWIILLLLVAILVGGICLEFALCKQAVTHDLTEDIRETIHSQWHVEEYGELAWDENQRFYGSYGDCLVVFTKCSGWDTDYTALRVAGTMLVWRYPFTVLVFCNGECADIREAYARGWLTWVQVRTIVSYHQETWGEMAKLPAFATTID